MREKKTCIRPNWLNKLNDMKVMANWYGANVVGVATSIAKFINQSVNHSYLFKPLEQ